MCTLFYAILSTVLFSDLKANIAMPGSQITYKGVPWYVETISRHLLDDSLINEYRLKQLEGFWRIPYYNQRITGVSVDGLVSGVERDKVQVDMELETGGNPQDRYWFPFSTVASSADGSGWYCMPEPGESVRVFFPVDDEKEGYVITNIKGHNPQNAGTEDPMGNPANRSITTEQGNQVQFTEMGVMIAAGEGAGSILLNKDGSVVVEGLKDMVLDAGEEIRLSAGEAVTLKSQTAIRIINEAGADVKVRGKSIWLHGQLIVENT